MLPTGPNVASTQSVADELAALFHRLGFDAVIRDPHSVEILAASPGAESELLAAQPGSVVVTTARIAGTAVRVELVRPRGDGTPLTRRQEAVAALLAEEYQNSEIAAKLDISTHTVRRHLEQLFRKLGVSSRKQAVEALKKRAKRR